MFTPPINAAPPPPPPPPVDAQAAGPQQSAQTDFLQQYMQQMAFSQLAQSLSGAGQQGTSDSGDDSSESESKISDLQSEVAALKGQLDDLENGYSAGQSPSDPTVVYVVGGDNSQID